MTTAQESKALVRRLVAIVNDCNLEGLEEVASGQIAEQARGWIGSFRDSFPDFHMKVMDLIAEGDKVVGHFKCSGTQTGEWRGMPPTGRRFEDVDDHLPCRRRKARVRDSSCRGQPDQAASAWH